MPANSWSNYFRFEPIPGAIAPLDGLRAIAILLVLFRHGVRPFYVPGEPAIGFLGWDAMTPMINGWAGVDLFFVLSGFLVSYHILKRWSAEFRVSELRDYLVKRILRIVPAYWAEGRVHEIAVMRSSRIGMGIGPEMPAPDTHALNGNGVLLLKLADHGYE